MRILVVDDQFQSRWSIAGWLSTFFHGIAIESAASFEEALAAIDEHRPDLVLASHILPGVDGIALARQVKAERNPPVVVVMTEQSDPNFETACAAAGADYCLEKRHLQARLVGFLQERFHIIAARRSFN